MKTKLRVTGVKWTLSASALDASAVAKWNGVFYLFAFCRKHAPTVVPSCRMNRPKRWIVIASLGSVLLAYTVMTSYLGDQGRYGNYQILLFWNRTGFWIQLAGVVLLLIGCVGLAAALRTRTALSIGVALILVGLFLPLPFDGGELGIFNVHSWTSSMFLPVLSLVFNGVMLGIAGLFRGTRNNRLDKSR